MKKELLSINRCFSAAVKKIAPPAKLLSVFSSAIAALFILAVCPRAQELPKPLDQDTLHPMARTVLFSKDAAYILIPGYLENEVSNGFMAMRAGPYDTEMKVEELKFERLPDSMISAATNSEYISEFLGPDVPQIIKDMKPEQFKAAWADYRAGKLSPQLAADFLSIARVMGMIYVDRNIRMGKIYYYNLGMFTKDGISFTLLKAEADPGAASAPIRFGGVTGKFKSRLSWEKPEQPQITGFNIYRAMSKEGTFEKLNQAPVTTFEFTDRDLVKDKPYYYRATSLDFMGAESAQTETVEVVPLDVAGPGETQAVFSSSDKVYVLVPSFMESMAAGGFNVYRTGAWEGNAMPADSDFILMNKAPVKPMTDAAAIKGMFGPNAATETLALPPDKIKSAWSEFRTGSQYRVVSENFIPFALINGMMYIDNTVETDKTYFYRVQAIDAAGAVQPIGTFDIKVRREAVPVPRGLRGAAGENMAKLDWTQIDFPVIGFNLYRALSKEGPFDKANETIVPKSSMSNRKLQNGIPYYYSVTALDFLGGESAKSDIIEVIPLDMTPPTSVMGVEGVYATDTKYITISWSPGDDPDIAGYTVLRKEYVPLMRLPATGSVAIEGSLKEIPLIATGTQETATETPPVPVSELLSASDTTYIDKTVEDGFNYLYFVTASDLAGNVSKLSVDTLVKIPDTIPPVMPTGIKGEATKNKSIKLSWNLNPEKDVFGYILQRGKTPTDLGPATDDILPKNISEFEDIHIDAGAVYYYVLQAMDRAANESVPTEPLMVVAPDWLPPVAPMGLFAQGISGAMNLFWAPNQELDMAAYKVYASDSASGAYAALAADVASSAKTFQQTSLAPGTKLWYKLTALDTSGNESQQSDSVMGMVINPNPPAPPSAPAGAFGATGTPEVKVVTLTWTANPENDIEGYNLFRAAISRTGEVEKLNGDALIPPAQLVFKDKTLKEGVDYWYVLRAYNTSGERSKESPPAGPFKIEPPTTPPADADKQPAKDAKIKK